MSSVPQVSVVIPTYNRVDRLRRVLGALAEQTFPGDAFEVVVVSDGSTDGTAEFLAETGLDLQLTYVTQPNQGPAAARNRGVELATGDIVLFVDDDVVADPCLVDQHVASHHEADGDAVVIGPMLTPADHSMRPWVAWEQAMLYKQYDAMDQGVYGATARQFYTGNASVPRARLLEVGGFDTRFRRAEDVELSYRLGEAGVGFVWNREAKGYHYADRSFASWLQTARDYGVNEVVFGIDERQDPTLRRVRDEYRGRHRVVRWLAAACVRVPVLEPVLDATLRGAARVAQAVGAGSVSRFALSGVFNLAYYSGLAEALGGAAEFHRVIVDGEPARPRARQPEGGRP